MRCQRYVVIPTLLLVSTLLIWGCEGSTGKVGAPGTTLDKGLDSQQERDQTSESVATSGEECDQFDNNGDGEVDEGCECQIGEQQYCFPGPKSALAKAASDGEEPELHGQCVMGTQECLGLLKWFPCAGYTLPAEEICDDGIDQDCNGADLLCENPDQQEIPFSFTSDCEIAACPPEAPHVVGCDITSSGGPGRACVAHQSDDSRVYFQEGDDCCVGSASGTLICSKNPGPALDSKNCIIRTANGAVFPEVTFTDGCAGCVDAHCLGQPYQCKYP